MRLRPRLRAGVAAQLAVWDALGKWRGEPVYNLLGGKTKERLPVYATTARPDLAKEMGFQGAKVPLPYGPGDGEAGMRGNIERLQVRAAMRFCSICCTAESLTALSGSAEVPRCRGRRLPAHGRLLHGADGELHDRAGAPHRRGGACGRQVARRVRQLA